MGRLVTVLHKKDSIFDNKTIRILSERRANENDKVVIINFGEGNIQSSFEKYDIMNYEGELKDIKKMNYNSIFVHLPTSRLNRHKKLIDVSDLVVLSSDKSIFNLRDFYKEKEILKEDTLEKTVVIFEAI